MAGETHPAKDPQQRRVSDSFVDDLFRKAGAERFGLSLKEFAGILAEIAEKYLPSSAGPAEAREFLTTLRLEELALARACAKGSEAAWDLFLNRYREKLYDAARSIAREESAARELADSLYADLFGTQTRDTGRVSKLSYYTGRGSLEGWLRTVLAQEYVNRYRTARRLVSLEEQEESGAQFPAPASDPTQAVDPRLATATDAALLALSAEDRFILAGYYLDDRTLAEIARMLGVHESTISRKLEKIVHSTRRRIVEGLVQRGMSAGEAEATLLADVREISVDVRKRLMQEKGRQTVP